MTELEIISDVIRILSSNAKCKERYASELDNFENRKIQASLNKYRLGVIGVTSSGKSTMINALLGESLLPAVARPSSSQLVSCFRDKNRKAQIFFLDGRKKEISGLMLGPRIIEKYADEGVNKKNKEKVKQIEITTPDFPFNDNIILIDSPGLDAYGYLGHEELTMNSLLPTIDFCIFVTTCKTNSDEKMLSVLNTIAEYEKPVIIVQNMIDSLKPSLDGKKTVADVAQEHRIRVERIVNSSHIKDKSKVRIVQISAINALKARQNRLRTKEDKTLLTTSNYNELVDKVDATFNLIRPIIEGHRMLYLKKEILRIAKAALDDGSRVPIGPAEFEYKDIRNEFKNKKYNCIVTLSQKIHSFKSEISSIRDKHDFSEEDIDAIKGKAESCETEICNQMKSINSYIINICQQLNIDYRNLITDFRFDKGSLRLKTKRVVRREGYWRPGERYGILCLNKEPDKWIDPIYDEVTDVEGTRQRVIDYVNNIWTVFQRTINQWKESIEKTEEKLSEEINNRWDEYQDRRNKALDAQAYLQIGKGLKKISDTIANIIVSTSNIIATTTEVKPTKFYNIQVKKEIVSLYRLSDIIRNRIHHDTIHSFISKAMKNLVIGWDQYCEEKFVRYAFNVIINPNKIKTGCNDFTNNTNSFAIVHKPTEAGSTTLYSNKNVFVLVNATQYGAAMNEISKFKLPNILTRSDRLIFVVQDFNEIINGNSVEETLDNISGIKGELKIYCPCNVLLLHDNPIYNLVAVEAQRTGCSHHYDEIRILDAIQKKFHFLMPHDQSRRNLTETTIRTIIQKLGKK